MNLFATAPIAIQLFHYLGARTFHMVGFDSIDQDTKYAKTIKDMNAEGTVRDGYASINKKLLAFGENLEELEFVWRHRL